MTSATTTAARAGGTWTIALDGALCDGHGICALLAPRSISLDRFGYAVVEPGPVGGRRALAQARRAVRACPSKALRLDCAPSLDSPSSPTYDPSQDPSPDARSSDKAESRW